MSGGKGPMSSLQGRFWVRCSSRPVSSSRNTNPGLHAWKEVHIILGSEERTEEECEVGDSCLAGPMLCYLTMGEHVSLAAAPWTTAASWGRYWMPDFVKIRICFHYRAGTLHSSYLVFSSDWFSLPQRRWGVTRLTSQKSYCFEPSSCMIKTVEKREIPAGFNCSDIRTVFTEREREGKRGEEREISSMFEMESAENISAGPYEVGLLVKNSSSGSCLAWNLICPPLTYKYGLNYFVFVLFGLLLTAHVQYHHFGCKKFCGFKSMSVIFKAICMLEYS